jgi:hypothetical protein
LTEQEEKLIFTSEPITAPFRVTEPMMEAGMTVLSEVNIDEEDGIGTAYFQIAKRVYIAMAALDPERNKPQS